MCNFAEYADARIKDENVVKQHDQILSELKYLKAEHFALLTLGNFFNDTEVSSSLRATLLKPLSKIRTLKRVLVESRVQYVNEQKLLAAKLCLRNDQVLEFAFGYESVSEHIRNKILNKGTKEKDLDHALTLCQKIGIDFAAYVLIKPQTLTEVEGIREAVDTALHIIQKARLYRVRARVEFEPMFVVHGKIIETLFNEGKYKPPKLWSIIEVLNQTINALGNDFKKGSLFVGLSDENLSDGRYASNCGICDAEVVEAIQQFNGNQSLKDFSHLSCNCKTEWEDLLGRSP
jgi:hypothetical protein